MERQLENSSEQSAKTAHALKDKENIEDNKSSKTLKNLAVALWKERQNDSRIRPASILKQIDDEKEENKGSFSNPSLKELVSKSFYVIHYRQEIK